MLTPTMMRHIWDVIESTQINVLLQFDDSSLIQLLLTQIASEQEIDPQAVGSLNTYIRTKLPLIRDTAEGRIAFTRPRI